MTIETKFNIGDEVYVLYGGKACSGRVENVIITLSGKQRQINTVSYEVIFTLSSQRCFHNISEGIIFKTKEELIESLFN